MPRENKEENQQEITETQEDVTQTDTEINPDAASDDADNKETHVSPDETGTSATDEDDNTSLNKENDEQPAGPKLESLSVLADRHRIPAWHQAALLRYMGWQDGKMVTDEAYRDALYELKHRRIGGGRK